MTIEPKRPVRHGAGISGKDNATILLVCKVAAEHTLNPSLRASFDEKGHIRAKSSELNLVAQDGKDRRAAKYRHRQSMSAQISNFDCSRDQGQVATR